MRKWRSQDQEEPERGWQQAWGREGGRKGREGKRREGRKGEGAD
jgi:hypothetical protein